MENQAAKRRVNIIASHLAANEEISATATHLFPMSCSNSLNSVIRRCDNRMYFSRQASSSLAGFMRQASIEQGICAKPTAPFKPFNCLDLDTNAFEVPMFSRPSGFAPSLQNIKEMEWLLQASNSPQPSLEVPSFARTTRKDNHVQPKERNQCLQPSSSQWSSPRMDVAESRQSYIIILELPGVSINSIRVELTDESLMVTGFRSIHYSVTSSLNETATAAYRSTEIPQGPYKIVWPLPANVHKDSVSAEFSDGLLHITVPKLSQFRQQTRVSA